MHRDDRPALVALGMMLIAILGIALIQDLPIVANVDLYQTIGAVVGVGALVWAIWQHSSNVRDQIRQRAEANLFSLSLAWNGREMMELRIYCEPLLKYFPADCVEPQSWLVENKKGEWHRFAMLAHFLVNAEYLAERGVVSTTDIVKHLGGGGWWARELLCLYAVDGQEDRVSMALRSLMNRYGPFKTRQIVAIPMS